MTKRTAVSLAAKSQRMFELISERTNFAELVNREEWTEIKKMICSSLNAYAQNQELIRELVEALKAERQMRKASPPKKLDEELCWRDNDEKADRMAVAALAKATQQLGG